MDAAFELANIVGYDSYEIVDQLCGGTALWDIGENIKE